MTDDHGRRAAAFAAALMELSAFLAPLIEAVDGYREDMIRRGYSPTAAEAMSVEYHRLMMAHITNALIGKPRA